MPRTLSRVSSVMTWTRCPRHASAECSGWLVEGKLRKCSKPEHTLQITTANRHPTPTPTKTFKLKPSVRACKTRSPFLRVAAFSLFDQPHEWIKSTVSERLVTYTSHACRVKLSRHLSALLQCARRSTRTQKTLN